MSTQCVDVGARQPRDVWLLAPCHNYFLKWMHLNHSVILAFIRKCLTLYIAPLKSVRKCGDTVCPLVRMAVDIFYFLTLASCKSVSVSHLTSYSFAETHSPHAPLSLSLCFPLSLDHSLSLWHWGTETERARKRRNERRG